MAELLFIFLLVLHFSSSFTPPPAAAAAAVEEDDVQVLLSFKNISDPTNSLSTWTASTPPSSWLGVTCSPDGRRVTRLVLENLSLSGPHGLSLLLLRLDQLRVLSLKSNNLSGTLPSFPLSPNLKLLFLSSNRLSGPIPTATFFLSNNSRLTRLDLSHNNLSGPILLTPSASSSNSRLITLRLNSNSLSGPMPNLLFQYYLPNLHDLDLSSNSLSGPIPSSLSSFPAAAFAHNPRLCGPPLPTTCNTTVVVSSSPAAPSKPESVSAAQHSSSAKTTRGISRFAILAIVMADFTVLLLVSGLIFCYFWKKFAAKNRSSSHLQQGEKFIYSSAPYARTVAPAAASSSRGGGGGFERGKMVFFLEGEKRFELEHLLKASAEMLGKGGHGTAYRAVLEDGSAVAVKRLREIQIGKREFESQMEVLGRLHHPNLVSLKAYYYARDENLLVYEYMPGGSLFSLLHGGDPSPSPSPSPSPTT